ncbi:MAG: glycosyltransferase [Alphaproteobacteria bacterium]|nr:glycosyltransferase [Alphaproteobacteria bacterium]
MRISIVTPVYNAPSHLSGAMQSVASQKGSFDLDYLVVDGGSVDGTLDIVKTADGMGGRWLSESDRGMYDAIAKGFAQTDGDIMGWLNADDLLLPGALDLVARIFSDIPDIQWLTTLTPMSIDEQGDVLAVRNLPGLSYAAFLDGVYVGLGGLGDSHASDFIQQESTFWRRCLWDGVNGGALLSNRRLAGDFALWNAFFEVSEPLGVAAPLGLFRLHGEQLSRSRSATYLEEAADILRTARLKAGRQDAPIRDVELRYYQGSYASKSAKGDWQKTIREFAVLPASPLKQALGRGLVF